jgi:hypothetical protein
MNAVVLQFPAQTQRKAKSRLSRVELDARHQWMMRRRAHWETVATDGAEYDTPMGSQLKALIRTRKGWSAPTAAKMRQNLAEGRKLIEKRNAVKAWLASMGANLDDIKDAEQALFFAFDQLA